MICLKRGKLHMLAALTAVLPAFAAAASEARITKAPPGMPIALYADAQGQKKLADVPAATFTSKLPLAVTEESNGYLLVAIDNRQVWVDSEQVTVSRPTKIDCRTAQASMGTTQTVDAGVSRGAGPKSNPCGVAK